MAKRRFRARRTRIASVLIGTIIAVIAAGASPALADVGGVYFDDAFNAAAGDPSMLFNKHFRGGGNVGLGVSVMPNLTKGSGNVALGENALFSNTVGDFNVATGAGALENNSAGLLKDRIFGDDNVATGAFALNRNLTGHGNVATGFNALSSNGTGNDNVATGFNALSSNGTGNDNVATGGLALVSNTTGRGNVGVGRFALYANDSGDLNVAVGKLALAHATGSRNVAIGRKAGLNLTTGSDNVDIANAGTAGEAGTIRIGNNNKQTATFIAGISGTPLGGKAQPVVVKSNGQLGVAPAASAKSSAAKPLSAVAGRRLLATVQSQQQQIDRLRKEVRQGR